MEGWIFVRRRGLRLSMRDRIWVRHMRSISTESIRTAMGMDGRLGRTCLFPTRLRRSQCADEYVLHGRSSTAVCGYGVEHGRWSGNGDAHSGGDQLWERLSATFSRGTAVALSESATDDFGGWGGTCGCSGTGSCSFNVTATCSVSAEFDAASYLLNAYAGNNQTGTVGTQLKNGLAARATRDGSAQAGITISYSDNGAGGSFTVPSGSTNSNGVLTTAYTLPATATTVTISVTSAGYPSVSFSETATASTQVLSVNAGNGQNGNVGTMLPTSLSVLATVNDNPTASVNVTFSDGGAGGSFGTPSATTNASGIVSTTYTLPSTVQTVTVTASAAGYSGATFAESATSVGVGIPASLFAAGWNSISGAPPPPTWCPTDSNGAIAKISTMRLWDSGVKWDQVETGNGTYNWNKLDEVLKWGTSYTGSAPLVADPACPMNVIYTIGGTRSGQRRVTEAGIRARACLVRQDRATAEGRSARRQMTGAACRQRISTQMEPERTLISRISFTRWPTGMGRRCSITNCRTSRIHRTSGARLAGRCRAAEEIHRRR